MQKLKPNASFKEVAEAGEQAFKSPAGFVQTYGRDDLKEYYPEATESEMLDRMYEINGDYLET